MLRLFQKISLEQEVDDCKEGNKEFLSKTCDRSYCNLSLDKSCEYNLAGYCNNPKYSIRNQ